MAKKNYLELSKVSATAHISTVVVPQEIGEITAHGQFVNLGKLMGTNGIEATEFTLAEAGGEADALVDAVSRDTGFSDYNVLQETVAVGKAARAYIIEKGMTVAINEELAVGVKPGDKVAVGEGGLGFKVADELETVIGVAEGTIYRANVGTLVYVRFV